ncbi:hypothetical protein CASFOL_020223 [Castilleja foliolosa]|uniref:Glycosyltransferase n=1 Tax=Castilleja foliolosa TaxID=1961234 RepID=A0ABD3D086_9LAMI
MPHIAIFPTPGMGHLIPLIELARKLLELHTNLIITFIIPHDGLPTKPQKSLLQSFPTMNSVFLPPPIDKDLPDSLIETRIMFSVIRSIPSLIEALHDLNRSTRLSAFIADLFGSHTFEAVKGLGIPFYIFYSCSAMVLSFSLYLSELDESCDCEYRDLPEKVKVPGCLPVLGSDLPDMVQDRKIQAYRGCVEMCKQYESSDGILINTFLDLELDAFKSFGLSKYPPVYPVGPLVRTGSTTKSSSDLCLKWLDKQPDRSVLFVSFGSGGTLSRHQLNELTAGLEMSKQRFLFVAKSPNDEIKNAAYFTGADDKSKIDDHFEYLSAGFLERTKEKGYVISQWAPQVEVLRHVAVGGFLSHCGWNSTLESIVNGVPLIAWPLFAEQRMNAVLLSEGMKVAMRVRENENGVVERDEISELARRLMEGDEGEEMRKRMSGFKDAAMKALSYDGSSIRALARVAEKWIG